MIERHLTRLRARDDLDAAEEQAIRGSVTEYRQILAGKTFLRAGELLEHSTLLLDGFMGRYRDLSQGGRQISEIHVPGDFADLHSFTLKRLDHSIMALTACRVAIVPHSAIQALTQAHPRLARLYWFSTNLDAAIHREWEVTLGRRSAIAGLAALFCELHVRLGLVGLTEGPRYRLPLTQEEVGDCLGLTPVHVNRSLRELRERGLMIFRKDVVEILDHPGLIRIAEFDPNYLYIERMPR